MMKTAAYSAAPAHPHPRGRSRHWSSCGRSRDRCATTCHTGHLVGRPPPQLAWVLGVPTLVSLILSANRELHIDGPVPHYRCLETLCHFQKMATSFAIRNYSMSQIIRMSDWISYPPYRWPCP